MSARRAPQPPPSAHSLIRDPVARGYWQALRLSLNADEVWLCIPNDVEFPEGTDTLIDRAFPELGQRFVSLLEHGAYGEKR